MKEIFTSARWKIKDWWWKSFLYNAYYKLRYRITGDCGHSGCGEMWLVDIETGKRFLQFVPEFGCPIHDTHDETD